MCYKIIVVIQSITYLLTIIKIYIYYFFLLIFKIFCITMQSINELCDSVHKALCDLYILYLYVYRCFSFLCLFFLINFDVF